MRLGWVERQILVPFAKLQERVADLARMLTETPEAIRLDLPETGDLGPIDLTIQSTVSQPRSLSLSPDPRDLGVHLPCERPVP